jgi:hypothetical protein
MLLVHAALRSSAERLGQCDRTFLAPNSTIERGMGNNECSREAKYARIGNACNGRSFVQV